MKIAFIGLGKMGEAMARSLLQAGIMWSSTTERARRPNRLRPGAR